MDSLLCMLCRKIPYIANVYMFYVTDYK
jgi:hypothetical protein